ncbi:hypothetical protein DN062_15070 [Nitrincola tibetensis]|jgi:hypothetical protein|uniref:Uncharacterized protein n=1 Tax=Nitrincola tibetensis TaxID=2219697 RepID=A0A364NIS6_9GAMM|nr:DUF6489 family protein [Nitrincola tibetensis]RAU17028.1 hypothetical protein DN062_15070 [Nitrincola tibetensis]
MKFKIDIEMTPQELRDSLGLPDVSGFHEEMLQQIRDRMQAGVEGYDPLTLFKPFMATGVGSLEGFQRLLMNMMSQYSRMGSESDGRESK